MRYYVEISYEPTNDAIGLKDQWQGEALNKLDAMQKAIIHTPVRNEHVIHSIEVFAMKPVLYKNTV